MSNNSQNNQLIMTDSITINDGGTQNRINFIDNDNNSSQKQLIVGEMKTSTEADLIHLSSSQQQQRSLNSNDI